MLGHVTLYIKTFAAEKCCRHTLAQGVQPCRHCQCSTIHPSHIAQCFYFSILQYCQAQAQVHFWSILNHLNLFQYILRQYLFQILSNSAYKIRNLKISPTQELDIKVNTNYYIRLSTLVNTGIFACQQSMYCLSILLGSFNLFYICSNIFYK